MAEWAAKNKTHLIYGLCTILFTLIITLSCWRMWGVDINVPLTGYRNDSVGMLLEASNFVRGGSAHVNVSYGAPYLYEYVGNFGDSSVPMPLIYLFWKITGSVEAGINLHTILNILLLAVAMFIVCIKLEIHDLPAMIAAIAYADSAYFLMYANTQLMIYSACFYIPLVCYWIIKLMRSNEEQMFTERRLIGNKPIFNTMDYIFAGAVMLFAGINSAYYAFLILLLFAFVGLYVLFVSKHVEHIGIVIFGIAAVIAGIAVYTLPKMLASMGYQELVVSLKAKFFLILLLCAILFLAVFGLLVKKVTLHITIRTVYIALGGIIGVGGILFLILKKYTDYLGTYDGRSWMSVEMGALRIVNMLLPAPNNFVSSVNQPLERLVDLDQGDYTINGVLAGIGYLYSLLHIFWYQKNNHSTLQQDKKKEILRICGLLNGFMTIVAIKGGLASLIAMYVMTGIRNYNRMCILIAVFSLISFAILLENCFAIAASWSKKAFKRAGYAGLGILSIFGLILSVPSYFVYKTQYGVPPYSQRKAEYDEWQRYMQAVEAQVPEGGMILELPLTIDDMYFGILMEEYGQAYELAVPAILSKTTSWSYATGHKGTTWKNAIKELNNIEDFLLLTGAYHIDGIYVDTLLYYDDSYTELLEALEQYLGKPLVCNDNRRFFYSMAAYNEELRKQYTTEELEKIKAEIEQQF